MLGDHVGICVANTYDFLDILCVLPRVFFEKKRQAAVEARVYAMKADMICI
jgi:hypothetical protein